MQHESLNMHALDATIFRTLGISLPARVLHYALKLDDIDGGLFHHQAKLFEKGGNLEFFVVATAG